MIDEKDFDGIKELSSSRGTSIETIMSSYNLYAGGKKMPENAEDSE